MITALLTLWLLRLIFQALLAVLAMIAALFLALLPPLLGLFGKATCWLWSQISPSNGKSAGSRSKRLVS
jgi:hypothetical protein